MGLLESSLEAGLEAGLEEGPEAGPKKKTKLHPEPGRLVEAGLEVAVGQLHAACHSMSPSTHRRCSPMSSSAHHLSTSPTWSSELTPLLSM